MPRTCHNVQKRRKDMLERKGPSASRSRDRVSHSIESKANHLWSGKERLPQ